MLKLYRRHLPSCKHLAKGSKYAKCSCPIWVDGMHEGKRARYSLDLLDWDEASKKLLEITAGKSAKDSTVNDAVDNFLAVCERRLHLHTVQKYRETLNALKRFCSGRAITSARALEYGTLYAFVGTLSDAPSTVGKKIERLRTFIRHCEDMGWCDNNPARKLKKPKVKNPPVVPFTDKEQKAILAAVDKYLRIPVISISVPEGRRSVFLRDSDQGSERSDAGEMIVSEVIGIVKNDVGFGSGLRSAATPGSLALQA